MEIDQVDVDAGGEAGQLQLIGKRDGVARAAFGGFAAAGMVHEDAPHEVGGEAKEVFAVLERDTALIDQLEVKFVHEGGGLQGVAAPFAAEHGLGQLAQLGVDHREKRLASDVIAFAPLQQEAGDGGLYRLRVQTERVLLTPSLQILNYTSAA